MPAGTPGAEPVDPYVDNRSEAEKTRDNLEYFQSRYRIPPPGKSVEDMRAEYEDALELAGIPKPLGWKEGEPVWEVTQSENGPVVKGTDVLIVTDDSGKVTPMTAAEMALMQTNAGQGSASGANNGAAVGLIAAALALGLI